MSCYRRTKFALSCRPVNITFEIFLGIHQPNPLKASFSASSNAQASRRILVLVSTAIERILFAALAISISIFIPEFSSMMAFLGSFSAFMLCVIGPVMVKVALSGRKGIGMFDAILLVSGVIMAAWGTYAAFAV
jgi:vesicular inhibitory amino acid transporter